MSRRPLAFLPAVLAVVLTVVLGGCSSLSGTDDLDYVPGEGNVLLVPPADREDPIEVSGKTLEGAPIDFADYRGKVLVVNVWWSGCGPCRTEMPMLVDAAAEADPDDAAYVGINIRDTDANGLAFERDRGVDYPSISDQASETLLRFGSYVPASMPSTVVLDREGRVAALINGAISSKLTLTGVVEEVAADDG